LSFGIAFPPMQTALSALPASALLVSTPVLIAQLLEQGLDLTKKHCQ